MLFDNLPQFPPALPDEELRFLSGLPEIGTAELLDWTEWRVARSLAAKGLIKVSKCDGDLWAEKLPTAALREA